MNEKTLSLYIIIIKKQLTLMKKLLTILAISTISDAANVVGNARWDAS